MFASKEDFKSAWEAYRSTAFERGVLSRPKYCGLKMDGQNDCVLAKNVGIIEAYTCINMDRKLCTDMKKKQSLWCFITTKIMSIQSGT